jgi:hypothetical protein
MLLLLVFVVELLNNEMMRIIRVVERMRIGGEGVSR